MEIPVTPSNLQGYALANCVMNNYKSQFLVSVNILKDGLIFIHYVLIFVFVKYYPWPHSYSGSNFGFVDWLIMIFCIHGSGLKL